MTKSLPLLTSRDIKNFIYDAATKVKQGLPVLYSAKSLCAKIGYLDPETISSYVKQGMPYVACKKRKKFILKEVIKWLDDNNISYTFCE